MAKQLKLNIKNAQIAEAINLGSVKDKLAKRKESDVKEGLLSAQGKENIAKESSVREKPVKKRGATEKLLEPSSAKDTLAKSSQTEEGSKESAPRVRARARSKSAFAEPSEVESAKSAAAASAAETLSLEGTSLPQEEFLSLRVEKRELEQREAEQKIAYKMGKEEVKDVLAPLFRDEPEQVAEPQLSDSLAKKEEKRVEKKIEVKKEETKEISVATAAHLKAKATAKTAPAAAVELPKAEEKRKFAEPAIGPLPQLQQPLPKAVSFTTPAAARPPFAAPKDKLGPTGRHIKDLLPPPRPPRKPPLAEGRRPSAPADRQQQGERRPPAHRVPARQGGGGAPARSRPAMETEVVAAKPLESEDAGIKKGKSVAKFKEFYDFKPQKRQGEQQRSFDSRARQGLAIESEEEQAYRRKRRSAKGGQQQQEDITVRPSHLSIRLPITIKDLAVEMKLKASQLISKLFMQGVVVTLNDLLDDETTIQLLGQEFGCEIAIDLSEEQRIRITSKSIKEEVKTSDPADLAIRPPVVAFMGHVDHGKTTLIDMIRKSNRAAGEAGAITQHIGAFRCHTPVGDIAILDTPGHEAFSAMRARGADVTDIVVLVVAGDEGIRQQTIEAIQHAKAAGVTIVVAINKCDKPNFNAENVYRQLADVDLLPEVWGGQIITVNCSAVTGDGIKELLEMLALQAEILELQANPHSRARGTVLESELRKGLGATATILVQNGTLKKGEALVFGDLWGRVKTMQNEFGKELANAGPSTPVEITGLSGLPEAGQEFIVVASEREAREIAEARMLDTKKTALQLSKRQTMESLFQQASTASKKILNLVVRADVQGSLEAIRTALQRIESQKVEVNVIFAGVGEVSESDVQLAAASRAVIIGFHTQVESHAEQLIKQMGIQIRMHDIIYHAVDDVKMLMGGLLEKIAQENEKGKAIVRALFKSSQLGIIAGCYVTEGSIVRNNHIRVVRNGEVLWKGTIASLKRLKEDVREVQKGFECGILLNGFNDIKEEDLLQAYEITYITQQL